jgi:hypothetical protein
MFAYNAVLFIVLYRGKYLLQHRNYKKCLLIVIHFRQRSFCDDFENHTYIRKLR